MTGDTTFFDTNILIYALASNDPRTPIAESLLAAGGRVSIQVLNEFVSLARKKLAMNWNQVDSALEAVRVLCPDPVPLTVETHELALRIARRYRYTLYDSLIVAAALESSCTVLCSECLRHGQTVDGLRIINPFHNV